MPATLIRCFICLALAFAVTACEQTPAPAEQEAATSSVSIDHQKYTLDNGLTVILHQDTSDPLVHVDVTYHVGSAREDVGKSGFAHFFEHMMFQGSKHVADEQHFKIITEAGGSLNGSTNSDRTNYYQTVPANQLEKVLWLESDRMGFLLEAVTQEKFESQRDTVKNERAQRMDNQPYGLVSERTAEALYPSGHPYSWSTIGYVEDLDRVSVDDLKAFFARWYGPNNAVLTIGGDIDTEQTRAWVEKYFGSIARGPEVEEPEPRPVSLKQDRYVTLEDNIHLPLLQITLPTVYARHPDEAPLDVLADILGGGKTSMFYKNLVKSGQAVQAVVSHPCRELACEFQMVALANPGQVKQLSTLEDVIQQTLKEFEKRGVTADDLARTKAGIEAGTVFGLQSVAGKVSTLAANETFYATPDLVSDDIRRYNEVTADDVMRVYHQYVKDAAGVVLSVVPEGQRELAAAAQNFTLPARDIPDYGAAEYTAKPVSDSVNRQSVPQAGPAPVVTVPEYWQRTLPQSIDMLGVTSMETPTVTLSINLEGGMLLDPEGKEGTAYLTALMLNESTANYSNEEMANALAQLGSAVNVSAAGRYTQIYLSSLSKHFDETLALLEEKLLRPAFLEADFARLKARVMQSIQQQQKSPGQLASRARDTVLFGEQNRVSMPDEGTLASVRAITLADIKAFYKRYYSPAKASVVAVSDQSPKRLTNALSFFEQWQGEDYTFPEFASFPAHDKRTITLVDKPGAVQSALYVVKRAMPYDATGDYFYARLMNFPLGGGFNSRINLDLREKKGITYAANSSFIGGKTLGWFEVSTDVKWQDTATAISAIFDALDTYRENGMTRNELEFMKNAFTLSDALEYETPTSKARFLRQLMAYDLDDDYRSQQLEIIRTVSRDKLNRVAREQLTTSRMQVIVVGDKEKIMTQLSSLDIPIVERKLVAD
ncbi:M16 family metallopeptidase [Alteromonas halophila]|uniref:Peptidase M16 n=1 Tax=Alteromonas halophila TaxID=516698 RepID=A0A918JDM6_9ALTE|nr:pitrilysin family protein [Alteromonas halophila]GGW74203.1 peptidase M16 [Alteromonas halophila]